MDGRPIRASKYAANGTKNTVGWHCFLDHVGLAAAAAVAIAVAIGVTLVPALMAFATSETAVPRRRSP